MAKVLLQRLPAAAKLAKISARAAAQQERMALREAARQYSHRWLELVGAVKRSAAQGASAVTVDWPLPLPLQAHAESLGFRVRSQQGAPPATVIEWAGSATS